MSLNPGAKSDLHSAGDRRQTIPFNASRLIARKRFEHSAMTRRRGLNSQNSQLSQGR